MTGSSPTGTDTTSRHSRLEDLHALIIGTSFAAFGLVMLKAGGLITGGLAGVALVVSYLTGWSTGLVFVLINLPFFLLASKRLGTEFTLKSMAALGLMAGLIIMVPKWFYFGDGSKAFVAVFGGSIIGIGVLSLARHRTSVGGIGILALHIQQDKGISAGLVQLFCDVLIIASAFVALDIIHVLYSILSAVALNLVMIAYHRPGRYTGY